jgi:hypothetical protein
MNDAKNENQQGSEQEVQNHCHRENSQTPHAFESFLD